MGHREVDGGEDDQPHIGSKRQDLLLLREKLSYDSTVADSLRDEVDRHRDESEEDDVGEDEDRAPDRVHVYEVRGE